MSSLPIEEKYARFEVFAAVTMKNGVFWDITRVALIHSHRRENLKSYFNVSFSSGALKNYYGYEKMINATVYIK
jgi:hypothetical protein